MKNKYWENTMPLSNFSKIWITNPRGQEDSYKKKKLPLTKGQVNDTKFAYDEKGLANAIEYANKLMREKKPVNFKWHDEEYSKSHHDKSVKKEGDGGSGSFGDGGGTVFTSTNSGIFNPTYGGNGKSPQKRKKRTGINRLADWSTDNSPERKMVKSFVLEFNDWVSKKFKQQTSGEDINPQTKKIEGGRNPVEFDAKLDGRVVDEQKDIEKKIRMLDDNEDSRDSRSKDTGASSQAAPAGLEVQLGNWESGGYQSDSLKQGASKDKKQGELEEFDETNEKPELVKMIGEDTYNKLGL